MSSITKKARVPRITAKTKVSTNRSGSTSLKSTIPEKIAEAMELQVGDTLFWQLDMLEKQLIVTVEKVVEEEKKE